MKSLITLLSASLILTACGGGDSKSSDDDPRLKASTSSISFQAELTDPRPSTYHFTASIDNSKGGLYVGATTSNSIISLDYSLSSDPVDISVRPELPSTLNSDGIYRANINIVACTDPYCNNHIKGSPIVIPVTYTIGDGQNSQVWQEDIFANEAQFKNLCANPRQGINPTTNLPYADIQGNYVDENNWLRSWSNDKYFWYDEIIDRDPSLYATSEYFDLLKTTRKTESGNDVDKFHFTSDSSRSEQLFEAGVEISTGIKWLAISTLPPREFRVAYVEPNSPAQQAGIQRGMSLIAVDGVDMINDSTASDLVTLNAGLSPTAVGERHTYEFANGSSYTLNAAQVNIESVLISSVISQGDNNVGYMVFNDHIATAQDQLIAAVNQLNTENITDLVLDLRYNSGGYVYIANQLAYMIAGINNTADKTFSEVLFNDKHPTVNPFSNRPLAPEAFLTTDLEGNNLPSLNMNRVFVLTSGSTCSASELVINTLRGIDVEVIQIGNTTCGKPYGFYSTDNCGTTYSSINFQLLNNKGFGDYTDGFVPSSTDNSNEQVKGCTVSDDLSNELGNTSEALLAASLYYIDNDDCPAQRLEKSISAIQQNAAIVKPEMIQNMHRKQ